MHYFHIQIYLFQNLFLYFYEELFHWLYRDLLNIAFNVVTCNKLYIFLTFFIEIRPKIRTKIKERVTQASK